MRELACRRRLGLTILIGAATPFAQHNVPMSAPQVSESERVATHLRRAIAISVNARRNGNHPFGALLVDDRTNEVVLEAENTVLTTRDITGHAELNLLRQASQTLPRERLEKLTMYTRYRTRARARAVSRSLFFQQKQSTVVSPAQCALVQRSGLASVVLCTRFQRTRSMA